MAISIQKKVMEHLEKIATESGYDFIEDKVYSNFGFIYLQKSFRTVLSFAYYFVGDQVNFHFYPEKTNAKECYHSADDNKCILKVSAKFFDLQESIQKIEDLIKNLDK